ncbi:MAG TPA: hypothetical protein VIL85_03585 [Thermomicrobiales bacterium]|jgi:hypothetical protein
MGHERAEPGDGVNAGGNATSPRAERLLARIDQDLPDLAQALIPSSPSASPRFLAAPDHPAEHKPEWHQFGIITHTRHFVAALRDAVPRAIRRVDPTIAARVERYLDGQLGDLSRRELLLIAGYWHDVGKFTTRTRGRRGDWRFIGHAHDSARLVTGEAATGGGLGARYGLDAAQIAFVARLADLHYAPMELKLALDRAGGAIAGRDVYAEIAAQLGAEGYAVCCLFWADCLAKGDTTRQRAQRPQLWSLFEQTLRAVDARLRATAGGNVAAGS